MANENHFGRTLIASVIAFGFVATFAVVAMKSPAIQPVKRKPAESVVQLRPLEPMPVGVENRPEPEPSSQPLAQTPALESSKPDGLKPEWVAQLPKIDDIRPLPLPELPDVPPHEGALFNVPLTINPPDNIIIELLEALPGRPVTGERLIRPDGTVTLGFFGELYVRGLSLEQVKIKTVLQMRRYLTDEALGLIGVEPAPSDQQPTHLGNEPLPSPAIPEKDPKNPLFPEGPPLKQGMVDRSQLMLAFQTRSKQRSPFRLVADTPKQRNAVNALRAPNIILTTKADPTPKIDSSPAEKPSGPWSYIFIPPQESDRVVVGIASYNSKVYYGLGPVVYPGRFPFTGTDTVLDAPQYTGGLTSDADPSTLRIARPAWGKKPAKVHWINLDALLNQGDKTANLQLLPGDRLIVDSKH